VAERRVSHLAQAIGPWLGIKPRKPPLPIFSVHPLSITSKTAWNIFLQWR